MRKFAPAVAIATALLMSAIGVSSQAQQPTPKNPPIAAAKAAPAQSAPTAAAPPVNTDETRGGWRSACLKDVKQFCRSVSGGHDKRACLETNTAKISPACRTSLDDRSDQRQETRRVCRVDLAIHCAEVAGGTAEIQCLRQKAQLLSPPCGDAMKALAGGE
jgi:hypothetical protein